MAIAIEFGGLRYSGVGAASCFRRRSASSNCPHLALRSLVPPDLIASSIVERVAIERAIPRCVGSAASTALKRA